MPRSFLVKKTPISNQITRTGSRHLRTTSNSQYENLDGNDDVNMTSSINTSIESVVSAAVNHVQSSNNTFSRCTLVNKHPEVCYWLENNMANLQRGDVVSGVCSASQQQQQQRLPLTILFGSAVTSIMTSSAPSRPHNAVTAPPWRPFNVHDDRPTVSTTSDSNCDLRGPPAAAKSSVDDVEHAVSQHHHTVLRQYTGKGCLPGIPFVPVLPDGLCSHLAIDQFYHQSLMSSVSQHVVCPTGMSGYSTSTARQQCGLCGAVFLTLDNLTRHQKSSCSYMSKSSSSSSPLSASTSSPPTRSPSPLYSCPHCDKTYTSSGALKMHVRTHTLPCRCLVCGKSFSRPWLLQGHLRTHTGERPFRCSVCGRAFADRSNLRAHSQTHAVAKRYQCTACRRSFFRLSLLTRHERHTTSGSCRGRRGDDDASRNKQ